MVVNTGLKENSTNILERNKGLQCFGSCSALEGKDIPGERSTNISTDY